MTEQDYILELVALAQSIDQVKYTAKFKFEPCGRPVYSFCVHDKAEMAFAVYQAGFKSCYSAEDLYFQVVGRILELNTSPRYGDLASSLDSRHKVQYDDILAERLGIAI